MIVIYYYYIKNGKWTPLEKVFYDINKAIKFCWMMKHKDCFWLDGWSTIDPYDNAYMLRKVNMGAINKY